MSLSPDYFFKSCNKYLKSLFKDGKKISPDFEALNQFYLIVEGDDFKPFTTAATIKADPMVLVDINLNIEDKYISESFLWNPEEISEIKINSFIEHLLNDAIFENGLDIQGQAFQQIINECYVQLRSQVLYKSLLKKHANVLLSFSTMEISQDIREYLIEIELKLSNEDGKVFFEDSFQWDLLDENNNVEEFCQTLIEDEGIPSKYYSQLCYKIKTQINAELEWKFTMLVKTFRAIHKDRESPKLNTQTMTQLKKNIIYTMDVGIPYNPDRSKLSNIYLNNSDLFSTLSRHMDILPEQFQQILQYKQAAKIVEKEEPEKISKATVKQVLRQKNLLLEDNGYLGNFANLYKMHNLWQDEFDHQK